MSDSAPVYRIGRLIGRGAVASVHEVIGPGGERHAGKLLHASRDGDDRAAARFAQEAELLRGLEHPNLVRVDGQFEGEDEAGEHKSFVRMELVEGSALDVLLAREAPLDETRAIDFGRQLAAGLAHAHGHGVVHRDLKPANVLVHQPAGETAELKIADFGMARASSLSGVDADALAILGTPDYMAPESLDPIAVDARADLYALGCMLFEMLTGDVPYPAATPFGILRRHRDDPVPPLPDSVSAPMRALVQALMAKSPADRPPSAGAVEARLVDLAKSERALTPARADLESRCAGCGQALVDHVAVCLNCGVPSVRVERGKFAVVIVGPGEVGDKLDSGLRDRLRQWVEGNPQVGLLARKQLEKSIPRMPIVFANKLSERSAQAMASSLEALGLRCELHQGMALRHPGVRSKTAKLTGRVALIGFTSMAGITSSGGWAMLAILTGMLGISGAVALSSVRAVTKGQGGEQRALPSSLRKAIDGVEQLVPTLNEARHRHALRAVLRQSLDLHERLADPESDGELARALTQASATTSALARIDGELRKRDLHGEDPQTRELLHRRDRLAGKMAELSGALESLRVRSLAASAGASAKRELDELRAQIEALEEVQAL